MKKLFVILLALLALCMLLSACAPKKASVLLSSENKGVEISDDLYGLFLEDISFACDGGLVSNLVANTGFEYESSPLFNWVFDGLNTTVESAEKLNDNNARYLKATASGKGTMLNKGYVEYYNYLTSDYKKGLSDAPDMGFKKGVNYHLAFYVKNVDFDGTMTASLSSPSNNAPVVLSLPEKGSVWQEVTAVIPSAETEDGGLLLSLDGSGTLLFDCFELVGEDSYGFSDPHWKYVSLRSDLYNALKELSPSFIRFPGGCLAEGTSLKNLYDWKETIGELSERKHYVNIWNDDDNGLAYDNTNSMGYHEYFQLCEDLGAKALPILNAGTICQFKMGKDGKSYSQWEKAHRTGDVSDEEWNAYLTEFALTLGTPAFDAYVQDILDLIEYANGDKNTVWGSERAKNGHEDPFRLQYIGIGNENWGDLYWRNFDAIYTVLKQKAPEITVISSAGPFFDGKEKEESYRIIDEKYLDTIVDEHYYLDKEKMFRNYDYYDSYPRDRQVFVGEYATTCYFFGKYLTKNNLWSAVEEAGYMCGFERNGDVVKMASYAPTFAKINAQRWKINLIWFDSQNIVLTPNYFNQMLFSNNVGDRVLKDDLNVKGVTTSATVDEDEQVIYYKVVNSNERGINLRIDLSGFGAVNAASIQYLAAESKAACNELGATTIVPVQKNCDCSGSSVTADIKGQSVNVIRIYYGDNDGKNAYNLPSLPATMEQRLTAYTKPYLTLQKLLAIVIPCGVTLLAIAGILSVKAIKKIRRKRRIG